MPEQAHTSPDSALHLSGNHLLNLQEQPGAWKVLSGSLDLFAAPIQNGKPAGIRKHIARLQQGAWLFDAHAPHPTDPSMGLLAVTLGDVQLIHLDPEQLEALWSETAPNPITHADPRAELAAALHAWTGTLLRLLPQSTPPATAPLPQSSDTFALADGQPLVPDACPPAARVMEGALASPDPARPSLDSQSGWFAPASLAHFTASGPSVLQTSTLEALPHFNAALQLLSHLHETVAASLSSQAALEDSREGARITQRTINQAQAFSSAIGSLAGLVDRSESPILATGTSLQDLLHAACQAIGREIDVTFPPLDMQDPAARRDPVSTLARNARVRARSVLLSDRWWESPASPLLAYLGKEKRPVALLPSGARKFKIVDPGAATTGILTPEIAAEIAPSATMFYMPLPEREVTLRDIFARALRGNWADFSMVIGLGLLVGIIAMLLPIMTGVVFNTILPAGEVSQLFQVGAALALAALVSTGLTLASNIAMLRIEGKSDNALQAAIWDRLLSLPPTFFRSYSAGDLAMRANGINAIRQILSGTALSSLLQSIFSVFSLGLLFYYSTQMALLALGLVSIAIVASASIASLQLKYQRKSLAAQGRLAGTVLQFLSGLAKLRASGCETRAFARWTQRFVEMKSHDIAATRISNAGATFNSVFSILCTISIFCVYFLFMKGSLPTGDFLSYNAAFTQFMGSLIATSSALITLLNAAPIYERAKPILTTLPEVDPSKTDPGRIKGAIDVSNLNFSYIPGGKQILKDVSITIQPGEFVAIVGSSGSGKSTLLRLLLGFEQAPACSIFYDGKDLCELDILCLRRQFGVVLQNGRVLSGDIFHNIIGASLLTLDDAWAAAEAVGFADDIRSMPMGMHTYVSEGGSTLSGGQRQRLLLARAIVHRPPLLMLDEATSALDNRTQEMVSQSMRTLRVSRLVIAHRLSTIVGADRIYVLEHGRVIQHGSYDELISVEGPFRELSKRQTD